MAWGGSCSVLVEQSSEFLTQSWPLVRSLLKNNGKSHSKWIKCPSKWIGSKIDGWTDAINFPKHPHFSDPLAPVLSGGNHTARRFKTLKPIESWKNVRLKENTVHCDRSFVPAQRGLTNRDCYPAALRCSRRHWRAGPLPERETGPGSKRKTRFGRQWGIRVVTVTSIHHCALCIPHSYPPWVHPTAR